MFYTAHGAYSGSGSSCTAVRHAKYTEGNFFASVFVHIAIYVPMMLLATCVLPVLDTIYSAASFNLFII